MFSSTSALSKYIPHNIGFLGSFSSDIAFLLALFVIFFAFTLYFGKGRALSVVFAFYPSTLLYQTLPFIDKLLVLKGDKLLVMNKIAIFLIFLVPISIILDRFIFSESEYKSTSGLLKVGGISFILVILTLLFSYSVTNFDAFHDFSAPIDTIFTGPDRLFYWNLAPFLLLAFI